jgi:glycosyltransferase involved in cell wall biosynthesis
MSDLHVLHVIETLGLGGGAEQALVNLLPEMGGLGCRASTVALFEPCDHAPMLESLGIPVHRLGLKHPSLYPKQRSLRLTNMPRCVAALTALVRRLKPDIIHAHLYYAGAYTAMIPRLDRRPRKVVSFHSRIYELYAPTTAPRRVMKRTYTELMRRGMDGWIAVTRPTADHYVEHLGLGSIAVIPNALPLAKLAPKNGELERDKMLARFGLSPEGPVIAAPGRMIEAKGGRFLIEAIDHLRARGVLARAVMLGNGPLLEPLRQEVARRGLDDRIRLHPAFPHKEVMDLMRVAEMVAMPSLSEGFGVVAAEAMALERPLIATRIPSLCEFVDDEVTGLLIPPANAAELARAIERVLSDRALGARLGKAARAKVLASFDAPKVAQQCVDYYRALLTRPTA